MSMSTESYNRRYRESCQILTPSFLQSAEFMLTFTLILQNSLLRFRLVIADAFLRKDYRPNLDSIVFSVSSWMKFNSHNL